MYALSNTGNETESTSTFYEVLLSNDESETLEFNETLLHDKSVCPKTMSSFAQVQFSPQEEKNGMMHLA